MKLFFLIYVFTLFATPKKHSKKITFLLTPFCELRFVIFKLVLCQDCSKEPEKHI